MRPFPLAISVALHSIDWSPAELYWDQRSVYLNFMKANMSIDIFVPFWGDPALLRETVESVLKQDSDQWFLTVLDDAYPDTSVPEWFAGLNHPQVRYIRNEKNVGIVGNYRKCLASASRELVMLLGCDDVLLPNYVSTVLKAHERFPQAAIIQPGTMVIDEHGKSITTMPDWVKKRVVMPGSQDAQLLQGESLAANLLHGNWLYWPSIAFRTSETKGFDFNADLKITHDLAFVMDMIFAGKQLVLEPGVCFAYRRHSSSASTASLFDGRRFADERKYFAIAQTQAKAVGWEKAASSARWHLTSRANALWIAGNALIHGRFSVIKVLLGHAFNRG